MAMNLAAKFSDKVDERFEQQSYAEIALGNSYEIGNNKSLTVYDVPVAPLADYSRHTGTDRYGSAFELQASTQTMTMSQDKCFNTIIDRGDLVQSEMVMEANKFLSRELNQVVIPAFDSYVFQTLAAKATTLGNLTTVKSTKTNAYEQFLGAQEFMGNHMVPDDGRVAICSYGFVNLLKQNDSFMKNSDTAMGMIVKGQVGTCDGVRIISVPSSRLPAGTSMIMTHPFAAIGPKQLYDYKIHDNPPGISGYKVEGRFIWDCFVLDNKANGIYLIGGSGVLKVLNVVTSPSATSQKSAVVVTTLPEKGSTWAYKTGATVGAAPTYGNTVSGFTALTNGQEIAVTSGHNFIEVVELDADSKAIGYGIARLNPGI